MRSLKSAPLRLRRLVPLVLTLTAFVALPGCIEKKMFLRTNPVGAEVWLDDNLLTSKTPVEVPYEWAGERRVAFDVPGHKRMSTTVVLEHRWFDYFPLDFVGEFLWPGTIVHEQTFDFALERYADELSAAQEGQLESRSNALRARADSYRKAGSDGPSVAASAGSTEKPPASPRTAAPNLERPQPAPKAVPKAGPAKGADHEVAPPPKPRGAPLPPPKHIPPPPPK